QETINAQTQSVLDPNSPKKGVQLNDPRQIPDVDTSTLKTVNAPNGPVLVNPTKIQGNEENIADVLGKVENQPDTSTGMAVVTKDKNGTELSASKVSSPATAEKQAEADKAAYPQATTQTVQPVQNVVKERINNQLAQQLAPVKESLQKPKYTNADFKAWAEYNNVPMTLQNRKSFEAELRASSDFGKVTDISVTPEKIDNQPISQLDLAPANKVLPTQFEQGRELSDSQLMKTIDTVPVEIPKGTKDPGRF